MWRQTKCKSIIFLVLILFLAAFLRFYHLGQNPPSLDWDEASLGWNAFSILKTGTDEYGKAWPVAIRSFNDYKPPLYVYATIPSVAASGLNEFSVRLPSALAGTLTVLVTYFLVYELSKNRKLSSLAAFLLAISPWHVQFSRVAFESNLALLFFGLGGTFLVFFLNRCFRFSLLVSLFFYILAIYSYHSPRVVIPLFLLGVGLYYRKIFLAHWRLVLLTTILGISLLFPLARNAIHTGSLSARFNTVASTPTTESFTRNYLRHFDFDFLFLNGDGQQRHHTPDVGLLYLWGLPVFLSGLYFLFVDRPKFLPILLLWFFSAPAASALTNDSPHAVRSLLFLPTFQIITAYGLMKFSNRRLVSMLASFLLAANAFYYFHQYFVHMPAEYAKSWQYGYKQMVQKVLRLENNYNRIYITGAYDQPYIYFLFYGRIDPIIKNSGYFYKEFDKYQFSLNTADVKGLYVFSPKDNPPPGFKSIPIETINFPDNTPAFTLATIKKL